MQNKNAHILRNSGDKQWQWLENEVNVLSARQWTLHLDRITVADFGMFYHNKNKTPL